MKTISRSALFLVVFSFAQLALAEHGSSGGGGSGLPEYSSDQVCGHYSDQKSTCVKVPFCRHRQTQAFCEKISGPNKPYACSIFNSNPDACNNNTFGNCQWNAGNPICEDAGNGFSGRLTLKDICGRYTDTRSACEKVPFCQFQKGRAFCEKISGPNKPYACQIFDSNPDACNNNTFGNCQWNKGVDICKATRSDL